jgi:hypothetical protein
VAAVIVSAVLVAGASAFASGPDHARARHFVHTRQQHVHVRSERNTRAHASFKPTVTGLGPAFGPPSGGTSVSIVGSNFTAVGAVHFGTTPATSFTVTSINSISAISPAGTGTVDVIVSTAAGISATSAKDKFNYGPAVTSLNPNFGFGTGGTAVVLSGTNFIATPNAATTVSFGTRALTETSTFSCVNFPGDLGTFTFVTQNSTTVSVCTPPGTGTVNVVVGTSGGTSATVQADRFSYGPAITSVLTSNGCPPVNVTATPCGPPAGGTAVSVQGTNFDSAIGGTTLNFGVKSLTQTATFSCSNFPTDLGTFTVNSAVSISACSPSGTGVLDVFAVTAGGTSPLTSNDKFSYTPLVTSLSPASGSATGGTSVSITGVNFTGAVAVDFGGFAAKSFTVINDSSITAVSPPGKLPSVSVTVTTAGGTSANLTTATFSYGPVVALVKPKAGVGTGGTKVTIIGSDFKAVTAVDFGTTPAPSFKVVNSRKILAFAPSGTGLVDVTVLSSAGNSPLVPTDKFNYGPTVSALSRTHGKPTGGTTVVIKGSNFVGVTAVDFGTAAATKFTVNSTSKITAVSPPGTGTVNVTVVSLGGASAIVGSDQFTY